MIKLSQRDKAAIQTVTRYSEVMADKPFEFLINQSNEVQFFKSGTTSRAWFRASVGDMQVTERYVASLASFALRRLARKHGLRGTTMIHPNVTVLRKHGGYTLRLSELLAEASGEVQS